jgi:hypothetical protein
MVVTGFPTTSTNARIKEDRCRKAKLGTLAGINIRVHYTWFFVFVLIAWSLALGYFPTANAGLGAGTYWVLGVVSAPLLFVSPGA